jgi:N-methylhydantoinase A
MSTSNEAVALGIVRVANAAMVRALRRTTVERGIDGRQCTLIAFGGAGPMHAVEVAAAYGIAHIVVPAHSSMFSALGCVSADMSYSQQQTVRMPVTRWDRTRLAQIREALRRRLCAPLVDAGHGMEEIRIQEVAAVRYTGQSYALEIPDPALDAPEALGQAFLALHEKLYGFATAEPWQLEALRMRAFVPRSAATPAVPAPVGGAPKPAKVSRCLFSAGDALPTPRHDRARLAAGRPLPGPAIVEDDYSTIVVPPGAVLEPDAGGHLHIRLEAPS